MDVAWTRMRCSVPEGIGTGWEELKTKEVMGTAWVYALGNSMRLIACMVLGVVILIE